MKKALCIVIAGMTMAFASIAEAFTDYTVTSIPIWEDSVLRYSGNEGEEGYVKALLTTDEDKVANGLASGYVYCGGYRDNTFGYIGQKIVGMEQGEEYLLTAKVYSSNCIAEHVFRFGEENLINCEELKNSGMLMEGSWCEIEYAFTYTYSSNSFRVMNWNSGDLYVDDISIKKVIYDGDTVTGYGDELVKNGDFETDLDFTPCAEVEQVTVMNMDSSATITWKNPKDEDFASVSLYRVDEGEEIFIEQIVGTQVTVTGLQNNVEKLFRIKTVDSWGNYSEGYDVIVCPIVDPFKMTDITADMQNGVLTAYADFKNNRMSEDYSVEMILAIFQNGALVDINSSYAIIPVAAEDEEYVRVSVSITVPEGEYTAVVYTWDSMTEMNVLLDEYII